MIKEETLKNSEIWAKECLSLPLHPELTMKNAYEVVKVIKSIGNSQRRGESAKLVEVTK